MNSSCHAMRTQHIIEPYKITISGQWLAAPGFGLIFAAQQNKCWTSQSEI
jgi:hypothetical protein